ncbi:MAG: DUF3108 domain-containing protein [Bacteroidales bacterium]|nr:DUF3108 domain-containing protein [Bacteroidales bacterium]
MKKLTALLAAIVLAVTAASAQCSSVNTAFKSGETLMYDLYFNWKFIWVKAGTAYMNTTETVWNGKPAYKTYLVTKGSSRADKFFVMRDTLTAYCGLDLVPMYYKKGALEGSSYRKNEVWYDYVNGECKVKMRYQKNQDPAQYKEHSSRYCAFDMISMLLRARSFDPTNFKKGHRIKFLMADGHNCDWQSIVYRGKEKFKMENSNTTYRCLVFSFMEMENGKESEVVRFYITDDKNHLPVRLDLNLNFGTAKAFLIGVKGLRNPQTSKVN